MWKVDDPLFKQLEKACGSKFMAINFIAACARQKATHTPGWVIESKLITWALTGQEPDMARTYSAFYARNPEIRELHEFVCYIDDRRIADSVIDSYAASVKCRHLLYRYKDGLNADEQARVRVLVRMAWYQLV